MEDNEKKVIDDTLEEETQEEEQEEESTEAEDVDEVEETQEEEEDSNPTLEDFNKLEKELNTLKAQKEHWRKKANKTKTKTEGSDEERLLRLAKIANEVDDEDLKVLETITGSSLEEKMENVAYKAFKEAKAKKKRSEASALKPSNSIGQTGDKSFNKPNISKEEHEKLWKKEMGL